MMRQSAYGAIHIQGSAEYLKSPPDRLTRIIYVTPLYIIDANELQSSSRIRLRLTMCDWGLYRKAVADEIIMFRPEWITYSWKCSVSCISKHIAYRIIIFNIIMQACTYQCASPANIFSLIDFCAQCNRWVLTDAAACSAPSRDPE